MLFSSIVMYVWLLTMTPPLPLPPSTWAVPSGEYSYATWCRVADADQCCALPLILIGFHSHMCHMTQSYVCHDSFICVKWLIHMCDMTYSYVTFPIPFVTWLFPCVTWLILNASLFTASQMNGLLDSYVWHGSFNLRPCIVITRVSDSHAGRQIKFAREKSFDSQKFFWKFLFPSSVTVWLCWFLGAVEWIGRAVTRRTAPKLPRVMRAGTNEGGQKSGGVSGGLSR